MNFGQMLESLKTGSRVRRESWRPNVYIYLVPGSSFKVSRPPLSDHFDDGTDITYLPHIDVFDRDGNCGVWTATHCDILAENWKIL